MNNKSFFIPAAIFLIGSCDDTDKRMGVKKHDEYVRKIFRFYLQKASQENGLEPDCCGVGPLQYYNASA